MPVFQGDGKDWAKTEEMQSVLMVSRSRNAAKAAILN